MLIRDKRADKHSFDAIVQSNTRTVSSDETLQSGVKLIDGKTPTLWSARPVLRSTERVQANVCPLHNRPDVIFYLLRGRSLC